MMGRVIHTGQVVIDLTLRIEAIPEPGGDVFADESSMAVGGCLLYTSDAATTPYV